MSGRSSPARPSRVDRQAYKWVMRMLDDPSANAGALERWLSKDPERREAYKRVAVEVGYASDAAAQLPLLRAAAVRADSRPRFQWPTIAIAGGLAAALGVMALLGWRLVIADPQSRSPAVQVALLKTDNGSKAFRLPDGSNVVLFGSSTARLHYSGNERAIDLQQGRARFSVAHDTSRPFTVYVQGGKVMAVGTVFEIDSRSGVLVELIKGRVVVTLPQTQREAATRQVTLNPGQHIAFVGQEGVTTMSMQAGQTSGSAGLIKSYDDVSVADIIDQVNAHSRIKIELADQDIAREKVFAELNVGDAEGVARKLAVILELAVERPSPDRIRLTRKR